MNSFCTSWRNASAASRLACSASSRALFLKKVGAGFRLAAKDGSGYFDCSEEEIARMLMPFFRDMRL